MNNTWEMSKLSRLTDMKHPTWIQPVFIDRGFWLYPFNYNSEKYPHEIVKLRFPDNKSLEIIAELTGIYGQWCSWQESMDNKYTRIVINIDWWLKKFKPRYLVQYDIFIQRLFKVFNRHIRSWKQAGAEYITISDRELNNSCINNYAIPTSFNLV